MDRIMARDYTERPDTSPNNQRQNKVTDITDYVNKMKWRRAELVARMTDYRWTIRTTEWQQSREKIQM